MEDLATGPEAGIRPSPTTGILTNKDLVDSFARSTAMSHTEDVTDYTAAFKAVALAGFVQDVNKAARSNKLEDLQEHKKATLLDWLVKAIEYMKRERSGSRNGRTQHLATTIIAKSPVAISIKAHAMAYRNRNKTEENLQIAGFYKDAEVSQMTNEQALAMVTDAYRYTSSYGAYLGWAVSAAAPPHASLRIATAPEDPDKLTVVASQLQTNIELVKAIYGDVVENDPKFWNTVTEQWPKEFVDTLSRMELNVNKAVKDRSTMSSYDKTLDVVKEAATLANNPAADYINTVKRMRLTIPTRRDNEPNKFGKGGNSHTASARSHKPFKERTSTMQSEEKEVTRHRSSTSEGSRPVCATCSKNGVTGSRLFHETAKCWITYPNLRPKREEGKTSTYTRAPKSNTEAKKKQGES